MANMSLKKNPMPAQEPDVRNKNFDEAMSRGAMYRDFERHAHEETCNLFKQEVK